MSDFGGLGIVLEENEDLRRQTSNNEGVNNHLLQQSTSPIITSIPQQIVNTHLPEPEIDLEQVPVPVPVPEQREEVHQQRAETPIRVSSVASLNNLTPKTSTNQIKFNSHISLDSSSNNVQIESTPSVSTSNLEQSSHLPPQEVLLPPLPDAIEDLKSPSTASNPQLHQHTNSNDDKLSNMTLSHKLSQEQTFTTMNTNNSNNINNNLESSNHSLFSQEFTPIYKNNAASFSNYALDSPTLLIDQEFQLQLQLQQQQQQQHQQSNQHSNSLKNSHLQHPSLHFFPTLSTSSIKQTDSSHNLSSNSIPTLPASIASFNSNTIANSTNNSSANIGTTNATNAGGNTSASSTSNEKTSPLKKLKNLTNGIRKLSLGSSSNTSSSSNVTTPTGSKFPNLNPLAIPPPPTTTAAVAAAAATNTTTNTTPSQFSSTTATATSNTANPTPLRSTLTPLQVDEKTLNLRNGNTTTTYSNPFSNASISHSHSHSHSQSQSQQPHIQHSSSSSTSTTSSLTSILRAKRARAASQGYHGISPITPPPFSSLPLTSPIITISENLDSNREAMTHMEQSYFDSLNSSVNHTTAHTETSTSPTSTSSTSANNNINSNMNMNSASHHHVNSIEEFTNLDDLLDYSNYLQLQKIQMNDIYVKTREKLEASGWCSTYDLDNLKLQQDASDAQIDTMILKIEEKLNRDFDYSMLNNSRNSMRPRLMREEKSNEMMKKRGFSGSGVVPSRVENGFTCPSLKVLESRCFSFTDF
ncbi:hypothetical protein PVL30_000420 [Lodderomyces elongisporus]|uniref:uncharacterized protein n=1 Tax=Lodderomyces elongisporus TaxID=36914 RepID=UPI00291F16AE|nr:uncharacterized protein PVL30_000420 [Lodderomyces elongisporus]WLF76716.1 hypothetical protein PVL30_000420 [Lodderomyces elongisporus]